LAADDSRQLLSTALNLAVHQQKTCTAVMEVGEPSSKLIGQLMLDEPYAQMNFLICQGELSLEIMDAFLDGLVRWTGEKGAFHLLAEVEETQRCFECLCRGGFNAIYRQSIWQVQPATSPIGHSGVWREVMVQDHPVIRSLFKHWIPPIVQVAQPLNGHHFPRFILRDGERVLGFVQVRRGEGCLLLTPLFDPTLANPLNYLNRLFQFASFGRKALFIIAPSHQVGLISQLETSYPPAIEKQVVVVKYLAVSRRVSNAIPQRLSAKENRPEPSTPIMPTENQQKC